VGILHGLNRIFGCESPHHQGQLTIGRGLDGKPINPQHVLRGMSAAAVDFHNKLDVFHDSFPILSIKQEKRDDKQKGGDMYAGCLFSYLPFAIQNQSLVLNGPSLRASSRCPHTP
jgi:hypothetical protein